jgi:hypothetical protein
VHLQAVGDLPQRKLALTAVVEKHQRLVSREVQLERGEELLSLAMMICSAA